MLKCCLWIWIWILLHGFKLDFYSFTDIFILIRIKFLCTAEQAGSTREGSKKLWLSHSLLLLLE